MRLDDLDARLDVLKQSAPQPRKTVHVASKARAGDQE
jgi:hypothetical protein